MRKPQEVIRIREEEDSIIKSIEIGAAAKQNTRVRGEIVVPEIIDLGNEADKLENENRQRELNQIKIELLKKVEAISNIEQSLENASARERKQLEQEIDELELETAILARQRKNEFAKKHPEYSQFILDSEIHNLLLNNIVELGEEYDNIQTIAELEKFLKARQELNDASKINTETADSPQIARAKSALDKIRKSENGPKKAVYDAATIERAAKDVGLDPEDVIEVEERFKNVAKRLHEAYIAVVEDSPEATKRLLDEIDKNRDSFLRTFESFDIFLKAPKNTKKPGILSRIGGLFKGVKPQTTIGKNEMLVALQDAENWIADLNAKPEDFEGRALTAQRGTDRTRANRGVRTSVGYPRERFPQPRLDRLEEDTTRKIPKGAESDAIAAARTLELNLDSVSADKKDAIKSEIEKLSKKEKKYRDALPEFIEAMGYDKSVEFSSDNASVLDFVAGEKAQFIKMIAEITQIGKGQENQKSLMFELHNVGIKSFDDYVIAAKENPRQFKKMREKYEDLRRQLLGGRSGGSATVARQKDRSNWHEQLTK